MKREGELAKGDFFNRVQNLIALFDLVKDPKQRQKLLTEHQRHVEVENKVLNYQERDHRQNPKNQLTRNQHKNQHKNLITQQKQQKQAQIIPKDADLHTLTPYQQHLAQEQAKRHDSFPPSAPPPPPPPLLQPPQQGKNQTRSHQHYQHYQQKNQKNQNDDQNVVSYNTTTTSSIHSQYPLDPMQYHVTVQQDGRQKQHFSALGRNLANYTANVPLSAYFSNQNDTNQLPWLKTQTYERLDHHLMAMDGNYWLQRAQFMELSQIFRQKVHFLGPNEASKVFKLADMYTIPLSDRVERELDDLSLRRRYLGQHLGSLGAEIGPKNWKKLLGQNEESLGGDEKTLFMKGFDLINADTDGISRSIRNMASYRELHQLMRMYNPLNATSYPELYHNLDQNLGGKSDENESATTSPILNIINIDSGFQYYSRVPFSVKKIIFNLLNVIHSKNTPPSLTNAARESLEILEDRMTRKLYGTNRLIGVGQYNTKLYIHRDILLNKNFQNNSQTPPQTPLSLLLSKPLQMVTSTYLPPHQVEQLRTVRTSSKRQKGMNSDLAIHKHYRGGALHSLSSSADIKHGSLTDFVPYTDAVHNGVAVNSTGVLSGNSGPRMYKQERILAYGFGHHKLPYNTSKVLFLNVDRYGNGGKGMGGSNDGFDEKNKRLSFFQQTKPAKLPTNLIIQSKSKFLPMAYTQSLLSAVIPSMVNPYTGKYMYYGSDNFGADIINNEKNNKNNKNNNFARNVLISRGYRPKPRVITSGGYLDLQISQDGTWGEQYDSKIDGVDEQKNQKMNTKNESHFIDFAFQSTYPHPNGQPSPNDPYYLPNAFYETRLTHELNKKMEKNDEKNENNNNNNNFVKKKLKINPSNYYSINQENDNVYGINEMEEIYQFQLNTSFTVHFIRTPVSTRDFFKQINHQIIDQKNQKNEQNDEQNQNSLQNYPKQTTQNIVSFKNARNAHLTVPHLFFASSTVSPYHDRIRKTLAGQANFLLSPYSIDSFTSDIPHDGEHDSKSNTTIIPQNNVEKSISKKNAAENTQNLRYFFNEEFQFTNKIWKTLILALVDDSITAVSPDMNEIPYGVGLNRGKIKNKHKDDKNNQNEQNTSPQSWSNIHSPYFTDIDNNSVETPGTQKMTKKSIAEQWCEQILSSSHILAPQYTVNYSPSTDLIGHTSSADQLLDLPLLNPTVMGFSTDTQAVFPQKIKHNIRKNVDKSDQNEVNYGTLRIYGISSDVIVLNQHSKIDKNTNNDDNNDYTDTHLKSKPSSFELSQQTRLNALLSYSCYDDDLTGPVTNPKYVSHLFQQYSGQNNKNTEITPHNPSNHVTTSLPSRNKSNLPLWLELTVFGSGNTPLDDLKVSKYNNRFTNRFTQDVQDLYLTASHNSAHNTYGRLIHQQLLDRHEKVVSGALQTVLIGNEKDLAMDNSNRPIGIAEQVSKRGNYGIPAKFM
jgi:hypothetical protein